MATRAPPPAPSPPASGMEELLDELKEEFRSHPTAEEFFQQQAVPSACFRGFCACWLFCGFMPLELLLLYAYRLLGDVVSGVCSMQGMQCSDSPNSGTYDPSCEVA